MRKKSDLIAIALALAITVIAGCAVRNAPQLTPEIQWELNVASELSRLQRDYKTFFRDVGKAERSRILTPVQVAALVEIGDRARPQIESAVRLYKAYRVSQSPGDKKALITALQAAQVIMLEITERQAEIAATAVGSAP